MANIPDTYTTPTALLEALQQVLPPSYFATVDGKPRLLIDNLTTSLTPEHSQVNYGLRWQRQPEQCERDSIGKQAVLAYKPEWTVGTPVPNKPPHILIRGDNYHALKALKHTHRGAIDVIYIDPPYNTGNKDFVYNDNFVDAEDGFKHSKWLSFMERRLKLAKELLAPKGAIFISIDSNEQSQLKMLCDCIFGEQNYAGMVLYKKQGGGKADSKFLAVNHEYVLVYLKDASKASFNQQPGTTAHFTKTDAKTGKKYRLQPLAFASLSYSPSLDYEVLTEEGDRLCPGGDWDAYAARKAGQHANKDWRWRLSEKEFAKRRAEGLIVFTKHKERAPLAQEICFQPEDGSNVVPYSDYFDAVTNRTATSELKNFFDGKKLFDHPKPVALIKHLIGMCPGSALIVLDFFGGSGTTAQAVIELNNEDGGSRQCIVATNDEGEFKDATGTPLPGGICTNVTHPRISKVLTGYTSASGKEVPGLPGQLHAFDATLADPLPTPCAYDQAAEMLKNYGIGWALSKGFSHVVSSTDNHIECATTAGDRLYIIRMQGSFKKIQAHLKSIPFAESDSLMAAVSPLWPKEHYHMDLPSLQAKNLITPPCSTL